MHAYLCDSQRIKIGSRRPHARRQNQPKFVERLSGTLPGRRTGGQVRAIPLSNAGSENKENIDPVAHREQGHLAGTRRPLNNDVHAPGAPRLKATSIPVAFTGLHLPLRSSRQARAADGTRCLPHGPRIRRVSTEISSAPHAAMCHLQGHLRQPRNLISAGAVPLAG